MSNDDASSDDKVLRYQVTQVLRTVIEIQKEQMHQKEELVSMKIDMAVNKVKSSVWGMIGGGLTVSIAIGVAVIKGL